MENNYFYASQLIDFCEDYLKYPYCSIDSVYPFCDNAYEYANSIRSILEKSWNENPEFSKIYNGHQRYVKYRQLDPKTRLAIAVDMAIPKEFRHIYWNAMWHRVIKYDSSFNRCISYVFDGFPGKDDLMSWVILDFVGRSHIDRIYFPWKNSITSNPMSKWTVSKRFKSVVKPMIKATNKGGE